LFWAIKGRGAHKEQGEQSNQIAVAKTGSLAESRVLVSRWHESPVEAGFAASNGIEKVACGSAGLKMCKIAAAEAEIYINSTNRASQWDTCASNIILKEAGGVITDLDGEELIYNEAETKHQNGYIVSTPLLHNKIRDLI
jgi:3'-phosphoadenosine 5'-phosphosulfate (PAPS) 3'-phosphatase